MKKNLFWGMALAVALASCTNEELADLANQPVELKATVETPSFSRVGFNKSDSWSFFWHNGDQIKVNDGTMTTSATTGSTTATFTGYGVDATTGYAAYPAGIATISNNAVTINFKEVYDLTATNATLDGDWFESAQDVAMYAKIENGAAAFKHLGGVFAFKINDWTYTGDQEFTFTANKRITGAFTAEALSQTDETWVIKSNETATTGNVVTVKFNTTATRDLFFYVPVPVGTYDIDLAIKVGTTTYFTKSYQNLSVRRTDICYAEFGETSIQAGDFDVVATSDALTEALGEGNNVKLSAAIETTDDLTISSNTTIDLNGNNLNLADGKTIIVSEGQTLKIVDSSVPTATGRSTSAVTVIKGSGDIIKAANNSKIIIGEGVNLESTANCCIFVPAYTTGVNIETSGNLKSSSDRYATVYVNGTYATATITVNGGSIESENKTAMYLAGGTTLVVNDGTITGGETGVEIRGGSLTINDGTITGKGNPFTADPNGNGSCSIGSAVAACQHTTNQAITATITGGIFNGVYALYEADLHADDLKADGVTLSVTGGTFNGNVSSASCTAFVKGGTFSNPSACYYLTSDADVTVNMTESYEGPGFKTTKNSTQKVTLTMGDDVLYTVTAPLVGSTGTQTLGFQFNQGTTVSIAGGKITSTAAKMLINNYSNLTLEGVSLAPTVPTSSGDDGMKNQTYYVLSNNCGTVNINNGTVITAPATNEYCPTVYAFDVCRYSTYPNVTVNVNSGATIDGNVEYTGKLDENETEAKQILNVKSGATINGNLVVAEANQAAAVAGGVNVESGATIKEGATGWSAYQQNN